MFICVTANTPPRVPSFRMVRVFFLLNKTSIKGVEALTKQSAASGRWLINRTTKIHIPVQVNIHAFFVNGHVVLYKYDKPWCRKNEVNISSSVRRHRSIHRSYSGEVVHIPGRDRNNKQQEQQPNTRSERDSMIRWQKATLSRRLSPFSQSIRTRNTSSFVLCLLIYTYIGKNMAWFIYWLVFLILCTKYPARQSAIRAIFRRPFSVCLFKYTQTLDNTPWTRIKVLSKTFIWPVQKVPYLKKHNLFWKKALDSLFFSFHFFVNLSCIHWN